MITFELQQRYFRISSKTHIHTYMTYMTFAKASHVFGVYFQVLKRNACFLMLLFDLSELVHHSIALHVATQELLRHNDEETEETFNYRFIVI